MVDLVKIRKKSRDPKAAEPGAAALEVESSVPPGEPHRAEEIPAESERAPTDVAETRETSAEVPKPAPAKATKEAAAPPSVIEPPPPRAKKATNTAAAAQPVDESTVGSGGAAEAPAAVQPTSAPAPSAIADDEVNEDRLTRFKRLAGKRRSWGVVAKTEDGAESATVAVADLELLRFRVAGEDYAVDIESIVEIVPPRATTRVPNAEASIVGIMSLRGTIVTVIDLRRKLGHPATELSTLKDARMIVVERAGETAGFLVDRVSRVVKLDRTQLESHPVVSSAEQSEFVSGVFQSQDGLVILLDIERILAG